MRNKPRPGSRQRSISGAAISGASDAERWQAVATRDASADGRFLYAVNSTGIYCRPSCPSKRPKPANVVYFKNTQTAEAAGFRPCKRCKPDAMPAGEAWQIRIEAACREIENAETPPSLQALARTAGMSTYHFHRRFRQTTGVTPKAYAEGTRRARLQQNLPKAQSVTDAAFAAGYNSSGRFYSAAKQTLGMTPQRYKSGGAGLTLAVATSPCSLGMVLIAATDIGIAAIFLGDNADALQKDLATRFPKATIVAAGKQAAKRVRDVVALIDRGTSGTLPLDIQGTAFEHKVWSALRDIPLGATASYSEIATRIGAPTATRAVARACAANKIAVAIPCHRVIASDGKLTGYRWGIDRKRQLLDRERERASKSKITAKAPHRPKSSKT